MQTVGWFLQVEDVELQICHVGYAQFEVGKVPVRAIAPLIRRGKEKEKMGGGGKAAFIQNHLPPRGD